MATTPTLGITTLVAGQASAEVTMNDALNRLDAYVMLTIIDRDLTAPPGSPTAGDRYLIAATATGAWASQDGDVTFYDGAAWKFLTPAEGMRMWVNDENLLLLYDGTNWQQVDTGAITRQVSVDMKNPLNNSEASFMYTKRAITVTSVDSVIQGSFTPSITWNIMFASSRDAAPTQVFTVDLTTTSESTAETDNSGFNDATIPAGNFVWVEIETAPSGTVTFLEVFMNYTTDP